jgi:hypothetical protein
MTKKPARRVSAARGLALSDGLRDPAGDDDRDFLTSRRGNWAGCGCPELRYQPWLRLDLGQLVASRSLRDCFYLALVEQLARTHPRGFAIQEDREPDPTTAAWMDSPSTLAPTSSKAAPAMGVATPLAKAFPLSRLMLGGIDRAPIHGPTYGDTFSNSPAMRSVALRRSAVQSRWSIWWDAWAAQRQPDSDESPQASSAIGSTWISS